MHAYWILAAGLIISSAQAAPTYQNAPNDFSDKRELTSQEIKIPKTQGYTARTVPSNPKPVAPQKAPEIIQLDILSPAEGAFILHGQNVLEVQVSGTSKIPQDHLIALYLNGALYSQNDQGHFMLNNLPRGTHTLQAALITPTGKVIENTKSPIRSFYQQRFFQK